MKTLLLNQYFLSIAALFISLALVVQLPSPAFDVCGFRNNLDSTHWYYCGGGFPFLSGFIFAFLLFLIGPNTKWYKPLSATLLVLFGMSESIRAGAPMFEGLINWLFSPMFGGSIFGAFLGFHTAKVIRRYNAQFFSPNKANQQGPSAGTR